LTEPYLDSGGMFRDAVISILAAIAKQERIRMCERVRAGMNRAREQGTKSGRASGRPAAGGVPA
jgi:DNA invertase Pin-like site-specific DNA recombinase